jgi:ABC-2 type transport system ATP-binding protein
MAVLEVNDVSIVYLLGDFKEIGLKDYVIRKIKKQHVVTEFWAVKNVSFSIDKGDFLGIVGTNGSGKSTLLKVVAQIMQPSEGYVNASGRIAALLELGSGFDGELTVVENIFLRGAMLGFSKEHVVAEMEEIIDFAELDEFRNRRFRTLSSGMKARLAFAIASRVEPDILILDEVLSVGDGAFREKSERRMSEIIGGGAATILVSHSLEQIRKMSNKVLWLDRGKQIAFGDAEDICDRYDSFLKGKPLLK